MLRIYVRQGCSMDLWHHICMCPRGEGAKEISSFIWLLIIISQLATDCFTGAVNHQANPRTHNISHLYHNHADYTWNEKCGDLSSRMIGTWPKVDTTLILPLMKYYTQIHPALQPIPAHSTLELCLWWLALDRDIPVTSHAGVSQPSKWYIPIDS